VIGLDTSTRPITTPFLRWAGGKAKLAPYLASLMPTDLHHRVYHEPFLGGGSMFFYLQSHPRWRPEMCYLSDALGPLINTFLVVRDRPDTLMRMLDSEFHRGGPGGEEPGSRARYEEVRRSFNAALREVADLEHNVSAAAWFIYLNKRGFNGLCRFNQKGEFNVPDGDRPTAALYEESNLIACASALAQAEITRASYTRLREQAQPGDVIYLDPPYVPLSSTANFTGYSGDWKDEDHDRLAALYRTLDDRCRRRADRGAR
jgi:DNA adenine methylase